ncbi:hypothetical protein GOODEAATRI_031539, partial [Goodea atripinnis]
ICIPSITMSWIPCSLKLFPAAPAVSVPSSPVSGPVTQGSPLGNTVPLLTRLPTLQYRMLS